MVTPDDQAAAPAPSFEDIARNGAISCPICEHDHETAEIRSILSARGLSTNQFAQLKQFEDDGQLGVVLTVGIHIADAITEMGEPTARFQENFDKLEDSLERIESKANELEAQAEDWRKERNELAEVKEEIHELEQEQLPNAVQRKLEALGEKVEGQLTTVNDKLAELSYSSTHSGTRQEFELATRARNLNLGDDVIPKGGRNEEDLEISVRQNNQEAGNIVIESKNVKNHKAKHINQLKDYCDDRNADIGLLVTADMPSKARTDDIDYWNFGDGILITRPEQFEAVYLLARYAIQQTHDKQIEYEKKSKAREAEQNEAQKLLNTIVSDVDQSLIRSNLTEAIDQIKEQNEDLKEIREYNERRLNKLREQNREQVVTLLEQSLREVDQLQTIMGEERQ